MIPKPTMSTSDTFSKIDSLDALHDLYGEPPKGALLKVSPHLTATYRKWIEGSRFCILSTVGDEGTDGSPRGDDGPVVDIYDDKTLLMPDWRGNNRLDSLRNIIRDPRSSLIFMVPGSWTLLRVNAKAFVSDDAKLRARFAKGDKQPATVVVFEIDEAYPQCAKAVMRADLWNRNDTDQVPTVGEMMAEMKAIEKSAEDYDTGYAAYAEPKLWG